MTNKSFIQVAAAGLLLSFQSVHATQLTQKAISESQIDAEIEALAREGEQQGAGNFAELRALINEQVKELVDEDKS